ncbi:protein translocase subunit SecD [Neisseria sp. N95_16]|uniref:Protein translocase subunit SecD n=1 Tax=Neisseria brasiliensis TaxID=2666100 RepID=A0A5Q3RX38_9NEIS|nr:MULTISPECIES: protein translocase subunit SecD [Neisseria]MRN37482.1 protein translocase subunit SecD [Neisseria brasiliensis]PJO09659.1 protein translocase subunit SecD [Neisseria sp. N95_16]PJO79385.1 protein translocase subunit SecD [Neisseria sp. N177_16]QGL24475.1 protein translocase subunit SecD [Neisseria brasiliensis]
MNRYPLWKYLLIAFTIIVAVIYALPNLFGETPAVQVSTNRQSIVINEQTQSRVESALKAANISTDGMFIADNSLKVRFKDAETQLKARDVIENTLGEGYITALNLLADSPEWMAKMNANPMFLGLDLRGGVHFTMQVDMQAAMQKTFERYAGDIRRDLRRQKIRIGTIRHTDNSLTVPFQDAADVQKALPQLQNLLPETTLTADGNNVVLTLSEAAVTKIRTDAVKQNITTLHNRVNELGVAEPVIQQSGAERIVVQLPGVQDTAKAKDIIGRTATLEVRMVEDDPAQITAALNGNVPSGYELLYSAGEHPQATLVSKQVELTGDNINDAQPSFDEMGAPAVSINLDGTGGTIFAELTSQNVGKRMAMVLIDQGKAEVVTAPVIRSAITGGRVQISGSMSSAEANDTSLLLRAGSLAAPMEIVEERTIGPSLGKENIEKGFNSTLWGFAAVAVFMVIYYRLMGVFSTIALSTNILFLIAILSALQATLTLPGIAALALTLGMAIDSNVLINERIREELRAGVPPQQAINLGYQHAWSTIVDSNLTSLIAGIALLIFGSGPVRGFAVVHCLGILTSMYSSVVVSRALVNLWYGRKRKLQSISIGSVWKPEPVASNTVVDKE